MKNVLKWIAISFAGLFVFGFAIGLTQDAEDAKVVTQTVTAGGGIANLPDADDEPPLPPEEEEDPPDPDAEYDLECDYLLGDHNESGDPSQGYRFVGGGTLRNTGNVGVRVRVTYKWELLGQSPKTVKKTYKLLHGQGPRDVNVTVPATSDEISGHQSADSDCTAKATIIGVLNVDGTVS